MERIKIIHIITGLGSGGAENMLYKIIKTLDKNKFYHEVISLLDEGVIGKKIKEEGVKVHSLNLNSKNLFRSLRRAKSICKDFNFVNTWLYHADIFGFIVAKILLNKKLIWNIRHSNLDKKANKRTTLGIVKINSLLSKYVDCITYNSHRAYENHLYIGYVNSRYSIIPNGFDLKYFKYNYKERIKLRNELMLSDEEVAIITVGRWDIQKDYYTLLKALSGLNKRQIKFKMLMVGTNLDYKNQELVDLILRYNLYDRITLLGRRNDIPELLSTADLYVSSSLGESFSNAIGEAMACELYCVVTDVGDSQKIVGDTGKVVQPQNPKELEKALVTAINYVKEKGRNIEARKRVIENYEINNVAKMYENEILRTLNK